MNKRGLSSLETCLFLILFASALACMSKYMRRSIQGNWKQNMDSFAEGQYDKKNSTDNHSDFINIAAGINAQVGSTGFTSLPNGPSPGSSCPSGIAGCTQINGWANYNDGRTHDD